jgi:hypothetical protein
LLGVPGQDKARSKSSIAPFLFFSFFTRLSTAFSAHFSSSSPCFHPSNFFTAGLVNEKRLFRVEIGPLLDDSPSSVSIVALKQLNTLKLGILARLDDSQIIKMSH